MFDTIKAIYKLNYAAYKTAHTNDKDRALELANEAMGLMSWNVAPYIIKAQILMSKHDYQGALNTLNECHRSKNHVFLTTKAGCLYMTGQHEMALIACDQALYYGGKKAQINDIKSNAWEMLASKNDLIAKHSISLWHAEKSIEDSAKYSSAWITKANTLLDMNLPEYSLFCFDMAIELQPTNQYWLEHKGVALYKLNRHEEALDCFKKVLEIYPDREFSQGYIDILTQLVPVNDQGLPFSDEQEGGVPLVHNHENPNDDYEVLGES